MGEGVWLRWEYLWDKIVVSGFVGSGLFISYYLTPFTISCLLKFLMVVSCDLTSYLVYCRKRKQATELLDPLLWLWYFWQEKELSQGTASRVEAPRRAWPVGNKCPFGLLLTTMSKGQESMWHCKGKSSSTLQGCKLHPSIYCLALLLFPPKGCLLFSVGYMGSYRSWKSNFLFLSFLTISPNLETQGPCFVPGGGGGLVNLSGGPPPLQ